MQKRLNDLTVQRMKAPKHGRLEIFDSLLPSFGVRVGSSGKKAWILMTRVDGKLKRMTLGRFPDVGVGEAREQARSIMVEVEAGRYVAPEKSQTAMRSTGTLSLGEAVQHFIERDQKPKNRSWEEVQRALMKYVVDELPGLTLNNLERWHLLNTLDNMIDRGTPIMANRVLAYTRRFLNWCVERGMIEASPAQGLKLPAKELSRDRVLDDEEIAAIWRCASEVGEPFGSIIRLLILTGQRREEVATMMWQEVDLKTALWTLPASKTKAGRIHEVPLSSEAVSILRSQPTSNAEPGTFIFPARSMRKPGRGPRAWSGFSKAKLKLDDISGVDNWRIHDLRRTAASGMARLGHPPHVISAILNHSPGASQGITAIYNRYRYLDEKRAALEEWDKVIGRAWT